MLKTIITLLTLQTLFTLNSFAQVTQQWVARYNGPGNSLDYARSLAVDGSGNVYVTGASRSGGIGTEEYATIKYNSSGDSVWVARYNGDIATSIAVDGSGNVYVTGTDWAYVTIKYNSSGVQQWVARYNGPGNYYNEASSLAVDGSGNVYVTGVSYGSGTEYDYATIKYNSSGDSLWVRRYNGPGYMNDAATSLAVDGSGNVYVTGESYGGSGTGADYATLKYNSSGVQQWVARYYVSGADDVATSLAVDGSGNVYVTGWSGDDYATIKYNSSGDSLWVRRYNGPGNGNDQASSLAVDGSGNVYVTGYSGGNGTDRDYATLKYNSSGDSLWVRRYNGPGNGNDGASSLAVDGSGNVYVTGYSLGSGTGEDYATLKYNSSGVLQWGAARYNGPGNGDDAASSLAVDTSGNVYVTGRSIGSGTSWDYATIKYSQLVGITPISNQNPETFRLEQNYPNPFNPGTVIRYSLPVTCYVTLNVYDALGREVETLVSEQLDAGTYEADWNGVQFSSGVYYYKLSIVNGESSMEFQETKKMILIK